MSFNYQLTVFFNRKIFLSFLYLFILSYRMFGAASFQGYGRTGAFHQALDHRNLGGIGGSIGPGQSARIPLVALTTARLLAGLQASAEAEEPVEDCTTMKIPEENRRRCEREMSM